MENHKNKKHRRKYSAKHKKCEESVEMESPVVNTLLVAPKPIPTIIKTPLPVRLKDRESAIKVILITIALITFGGVLAYLTGVMPSGVFH